MLNNLTQEYVKSILHYDPETGVLIWIKGRGLKTRPGCIAGSFDRDGYRRVKIKSVEYRAHRLAWLYMTGKWPELEIDHIDKNPGNNKWSNLRDVSRLLNVMNRRCSLIENRAIGDLVVHHSVTFWRTKGVEF